MENRYSVLVEQAFAIRAQIIERHQQGKLAYERDMATLAHEIVLMARLNETFAVGQLFLAMGAIEFYRGHFIAAYDYVVSALRSFEEVGIEERIVSALNNLGEIHRQWGKHAEALSYYTQGLERATASEEWSLVAMLENNIGMLHLEQGRPAEALEHFRQALAHSARVTPRAEVESETYSGIARACLALDDMDGAWQAAERALTIGQEHNHSLDIATAYRALGIVAARVPGRGANPAGYFKQSRDIFQACGAQAEHARTLLAEGRWWLEIGHPERASELLTQARDRLAALKLVDEAAEAQHLLDSLA